MGDPSGLTYVGTDIAFRVMVEFESDSGAWVDLNALEEDGYPDYYGGLLAFPSFSFESEDDRGTFVSSISALVFDNSKRYDLRSGGDGIFTGSEIGFWDAPFPKTIRQNGSGPIQGYTFSRFFRRKVRVRVVFYEGGAATDPQSLGIFRIEDIIRRDGRATVQLSSLHKIFTDRSAATIRHGSAWYRAAPINFLVKLLAKAADPGMETNAEIDTETVDLGTFEAPSSASQTRSTVWGQVPGFNEDGHPPARHMIPTCFCVDSSDPDILYVGAIDLGASNEETPNGAVYKFNTQSGAWTPIVNADIGDFRPIAIAHRMLGPSSDLPYLLVFNFREAKPNVDFWEFGQVRQVRVDLTNGAGTRSSQVSMWDTRYTIRSGVYGGALGSEGTYFIGGIANVYTNDFDWYGESMPIAFPQVIECLADLMFGAVIRDFDEVGVYLSWMWWAAYWHMCWQLGQGMGSQVDLPVPADGPDGYGFYAGFILMDLEDLPGCAMRYSLNPHHIEPIFLEFDNGDAIPSNEQIWFFYIRNPTTWSGSSGGGSERWYIEGRRAVDFAVSWWAIPWVGLGNKTFFERQINAFCLAPGTDTTTDPFNFWVHFVAYKEVAHSDDADQFNPRWSVSYIEQVEILLANENGDASHFALWSHDLETLIPWGEGYGFAWADNPRNYAATIVDMFCPWVTGSENTVTESYMIACVLNRGDVGAPSYGIGIWSQHRDNDPTDPGWIQSFALPPLAAVAYPQYPPKDYIGPRSKRPFGGFVQDPANSKKVYFVDQSSGQVWSVTVHDDTDPVDPRERLTWSLENKGFSIHSSEHALASPRGVVTVGSDTHQRFFWGMGKGLPGEMALQHPWRDRHIIVNGADYYFNPRNSHMRWTPGATYPLVMLSTKAAHVVEIADFSDWNVWEALVHLRELAWLYRMFIDRDGVFNFKKRAEGTPVAKLMPRNAAGYADPLASTPEYMINDSFSVDSGIHRVINGVDGTPYRLISAGEAEVESIQTGGSEFAGQYKVKVHTQEPRHIALICRSGGDVLTGTASLGAENLVLFSWHIILPRLRAYLVAPCYENSTTIQFAGLTFRDQEYIWSDGYEIPAGHFFTGDWGLVNRPCYLRVAGGPWVEIGSWTGGLAGVESVGAILDGTIDVNAPAYSEVEIWISEAMGQSDHPDYGIGLTGNRIFSATDEWIPVRSVQVFRPGMVLLIEDEYMQVITATGEGQYGWVRVRRGLGGTEPKSHGIQEVIRGYVRIQKPNKMYEVGNLGFSFGVYIDTDDTDDEKGRRERTITDGDSVTITTFGLTLKEMDQSSVRAELQGSVEAYGSKDYTLNNRLLDVVKTDIICSTIIDEDGWPRIGLSCVIDLAIWLEPADTIEIDDPQIVPGGTAVNFEVTGLRHDLASFETHVTLRSFALEGEGKLEPPAPPVPPRGRTRGSRHYRYELG